MPSLQSEDITKLKKLGFACDSESEFAFAIAFREPCNIAARSRLVSVKLDMFSSIGEDCVIICCNIGRYCSVGNNVQFGLGMHDMSTVSTSSIFFNGHEFDFTEFLSNHPLPLHIKRQGTAFSCVTVGNDVWVGDNVLAPSDIIIGHGAVIKPGSILTKDVPPFTVVEDINHIVKQRFSDEIISDLLEIQWWNYNIPLMLQRGIALNLDEPKEFIAQFKDLDPASLIPISPQGKQFMVFKERKKPTRIELQDILYQDFDLYYDPRHPS